MLPSRNRVRSQSLPSHKWLAIFDTRLLKYFRLLYELHRLLPLLSTLLSLGMLSHRRLGLRISSSAAEAINGPPIRNQKTYTFGFNKFVIMPLRNEPVGAGGVFIHIGGFQSEAFVAHLSEKNRSSKRNHQ